MGGVAGGKEERGGENNARLVTVTTTTVVGNAGEAEGTSCVRVVVALEEGDQIMPACPGIATEARTLEGESVEAVQEAREVREGLEGDRGGALDGDQRCREAGRRGGPAGEEDDQRVRRVIDRDSEA